MAVLPVIPVKLVPQVPTEYFPWHSLSRIRQHERFLGRQQGSHFRPTLIYTSGMIRRTALTPVAAELAWIIDGVDVVGAKTTTSSDADVLFIALVTNQRVETGKNRRVLRVYIKARSKVFRSNTHCNEVEYY